MSVRVQVEAFDVGAELAKLHDVGMRGTGSLVTFSGIVRDIADNQTIKTMTLEHYPGMTLRELEKIEAEAWARWFPSTTCQAGS